MTAPTMHPSAHPGTGTRAAAERVDAARALLAHPILTASSHPDELALIRLHAPALRSMFANLLGYGLVVEASFARLVKAPLTADAPPRASRRADGSAFTASTYTYLALLCAALLSAETGEQILISALIDQVRSDAATIGVQISDTLPERRALVTALGQLIAWGLLTETDGTTAAWGERRDEALLTVHRPLLAHLLARPLSGMDHPDDLFGAGPVPGEAPVEQPRRGLRRKLVENPLVRREDLTDAERDVLSRDRTDLTTMLADTFGLTLEVRAEGALAYDNSAAVTDIAFPGPGTVKQAALLLLAELADVLEPEAGAVAVLDDGRAVPGALARWELLDAALAALAGQHRKAWGATVVENPRRMRDDVTALLCEVGLAVRSGAGLVIHAASARYRPLPRAAPPTRALRRLDAPGAPEPDGMAAETLF
jgi:uncharacterized protein (TIGR02678 family)